MNKGSAAKPLSRVNKLAPTQVQAIVALPEALRGAELTYKS